MNDDAFLDRCIGLGALTVGCSVIFFALKLPWQSPVTQLRKIFGFVVAAVLILYGLYSLVVG